MPDFSIENSLQGVIAGIDEAGRGPWAGPVVAAIVLLNRDCVPDGINDSKQIPLPERERLYDEIISSAHTAVGISSVEEIDSYNILGATKLAMQRAYNALALGMHIDYALIDGNQPPTLPCLTLPVIKGDAISLSIAAASILAKVTRDRMMRELAQHHPGYGWETNVGYGTEAHQRGIAKLGLTPHHRRSFAPIRRVLEALEAV